MSYFPTNLHIGQDAKAGELANDKGITSSQGKRLRDRDEYAKSLMTGGASAPEGLDVSSLAVAGFLSAPQVIFATGLSAANGSYSTSIDIRNWAPYQTWLWVINRGFTLTKTSYIHCQGQFTLLNLARRRGAVWAALFLDSNIGLVLSWQLIEWVLLAPTRPSGLYSETLNLSWDGVLSPGAHALGIALYVATPPTGFNHMSIYAEYSPALSILIV